MQATFLQQQGIKSLLVAMGTCPATPTPPAATALVPAATALVPALVPASRSVAVDGEGWAILPPVSDSDSSSSPRGQKETTVEEVQQVGM